MKNCVKEIVGIILVLSLVSFLVKKTDIEIIKERVISELLISSANDGRIQSLIQSQRADGTWSGINYEDVSNEGFQHVSHLGSIIYYIY